MSLCKVNLIFVQEYTKYLYIHMSVCQMYMTQLYHPHFVSPKRIFISQKDTFDIFQAKFSHFNCHGYNSLWYYFYSIPCNTHQGISSVWNNELVITIDLQTLNRKFVQHRGNRLHISNLYFCKIIFYDTLKSIYNSF